MLIPVDIRFFKEGLLLNKGDSYSVCKIPIDGRVLLFTRTLEGVLIFSVSPPIKGPVTP
jgi:hypothetical protein